MHRFFCYADTLSFKLQAIQAAVKLEPTHNLLLNYLVTALLSVDDAGAEEGISCGNG